MISFGDDAAAEDFLGAGIGLGVTEADDTTSGAAKSSYLDYPIS